MEKSSMANRNVFNIDFFFHKLLEFFELFLCICYFWLPVDGGKKAFWPENGVNTAYNTSQSLIPWLIRILLGILPNQIFRCIWNQIHIRIFLRYASVWAVFLFRMLHDFSAQQLYASVLINSVEMSCFLSPLSILLAFCTHSCSR